MVKTPAGRPHYFRNDDFSDATVFLVVGDSGKETVVYEAA